MADNEKKVELTEQEKKDIEEAMKKAQSPNVLTDDTFKMGAGEIDIRKLSPENQIQIIVRLLSTLTTQNLQLTQAVVDLERLFMLLLTTKKGWTIEQLTKKLGKMLDDLAENSEKIQNKENLSN